ncbi:MAG: hypothetical protein E6Q97_20235 [Desulfurellales bacterium]|nr:MAG: hypothetical protein E6Q97_20235 [Desulfurellales bacterium]
MRSLLTFVESASRKIAQQLRACNPERTFSLARKARAWLLLRYERKEEEMKPALKREKRELYHVVNGERVLGAPPELKGDVSGLCGNASGLSGDATGLRGDLDECELTAEDRARGVAIESLVG